MNNKSFETFFKERNPNYSFLLSRMRKALDVKEVRYEDINVANMTQVKEYLLHDGKSAESSVKVYMAVISATCNVLACDGLIRPVNFKLIGRIKATKTENIALTEEEVHLFVNYYNSIKLQPKRKTEIDVLTLFLIEVFSGARSSDVARFSNDNITNGVLTYISKKTHTLTRLPSHRMLPELIARIPKKEYNRTTTNRIIKETAKMLGIDAPEKRNYRGELKFRPRYKYIGVHSARRTFISLLLDKGVPIASVSKMAGHSSPDMTMRYYCSDKLNLCEEAMAFFNS